MGMSLTLAAIVSLLHALAFALAFGAERRRSTGRPVPDEYDERTFCVYDSDASTVYGLSAFGLLLLSQTVVSVATGCLCLGRGPAGAPRARPGRCAVICCVFSWLTFLIAEACLLAGSAKNAYHTKYVGYYTKKDLVSCAELRRGVFAAAAAMILLSLAASLLLFWAHSKTERGGWQRHSNEGGLRMQDYNNPQKDNNPV